MFPVYTGMNRNYRRFAGGMLSVPRVYGDEPNMTSPNNPRETVFPVYTGMNRQLIGRVLLLQRVPRVYGDEPGEVEIRECGYLCSPCIRG